MESEQVEARRIPVPGVCRETAAIIERIKTGRPGDIITDEELTKLIGKPTRPGGKGYGNLMSAIGRCIREYRILWQRIREGGCIECVSNSGKVLVAKAKRKQMYRKAKQSLVVTASIDLDGLSDDEKRRCLVESATAGTVIMMTKNATFKKLEARNVNNSLDLPRLLDAFPK